MAAGRAWMPILFCTTNSLTICPPAAGTSLLFIGEVIGRWLLVAAKVRKLRHLGAACNPKTRCQARRHGRNGHHRALPPGGYPLPAQALAQDTGQAPGAVGGGAHRRPGSGISALFRG